MTYPFFTRPERFRSTVFGVFEISAAIATCDALGFRRIDFKIASSVLFTSSYIPIFLPTVRNFQGFFSDFRELRAVNTKKAICNLSKSNRTTQQRLLFRRKAISGPSKSNRSISRDCFFTGREQNFHGEQVFTETRKEHFLYCFWIAFCV